MRLITTFIFAVLGLAALIYSAYTYFPRTRIISYQVAKPVWEHRTKTITKMVEVRGEKVEVTIEVPDKVVKTITEERQRKIAPERWDYLRFSIVAGIAVLFGIYMLVIFAMLARDKWVGKRETQGAQDTKRRADALVTFSVGVLVGVIGAPYSQSQEQYIKNAPSAFSAAPDEPDGVVEQTPAVGDPDTPQFVPNPPAYVIPPSDTERKKQ